MLQLSYSTKEEIPEGSASLYAEKDGKWALQLADNVVPKSQLDEFRSNNIDLLKAKDALAKQLKTFDGVDLDKYNTALKKIQDTDDQNLLDAGKVDELVEKRVERMKSDFDGKSNALGLKIDELGNENSSLKVQLSDVLINSQINQAINEIGRPREGAIQDIIRRGKALYQIVDGTPTPIGPDGNTVFGKDGKQALTFKEWATGLMETAGFLFETATGGGATGNMGNNAGVKSKIIASGDVEAFGHNLADIAAGKVSVV